MYRQFVIPAVCTESVSVLESDVETVHPLLLGDDVMVPHISRLMEQLGVRRLTPTDMIHHHILPTLRSSSWQVSTAVSYRIVVIFFVWSDIKSLSVINGQRIF